MNRSNYPKPEQAVSSCRCALISPGEGVNLPGVPAEAGVEQVTQRLHLPSSRGRRASASFGSRGAPKRPHLPKSSRSSGRFAAGAEAPEGSYRGGRKLASHPCLAGTEVTAVRGQCHCASAGHEPGARRATGKLMAPPLRFFVLSAFVSSGGRFVPVYLAGTFRSQGFSPSQRFAPSRALRLCFASHPPLGFRSSELFPLSQPRHLSVLVALLSLHSARVARVSPCHLCPNPWLPAWTGASALLWAPSHLCSSTRFVTSSPLGLPKPPGRVRAVSPLAEGWCTMTLRTVQRSRTGQEEQLQVGVECQL